MHKKLVWKRLVGQARIRQALGAAFVNESLGHAYLFSGPAGVGKFQAALELSCALLCEHPDEVPCYCCESCRQIMHGAHPDFHCVFPVALEREHKTSGDSGSLNEEGWSHIGKEAIKKIGSPYDLGDPRMLTIPVDWVRELNHSIMRGAVRGSVNVAIICDADVMQPGSANALLKTLEEPPPRTIIFICTRRPHAILPTIRSRCQTVRFGNIAADRIAEALSAAFSLPVGDQRIARAVAGGDGSYGKALSLMDESLDVFAEQADALWQLCLRRPTLHALAGALDTLSNEHLGGGYDYAASEKVLLSFLSIVRASFFAGVSGTEKYITGTGHGQTPLVIDAAAADRLSGLCEKALADVRARANGLLVFLTFLLSLMEIMHGKKQ